MMCRSNFLGFDFSPLKLEDIGVLSDFLRRYPQQLTGYTFATLAAWNTFFQYKWTFAAPELLLISCTLDSDPYPRLLQPIGHLTEELIDMLLTRAADLNYPLKIIGVSEQFLKEHPAFADRFHVVEDRAVSNYLYSAQALAQLKGRKYAKKRNLISQAKTLYSWTSASLSKSLLDSCFAVLDSIMKEERPVLEGMLGRELAALKYTLEHFEEFQQQGLLITVDGRPVAFSIFEPINPATVAIHFERALRSYKGMYQVINWETAKVIAEQGFEYINREEDLGDPGLRDAKLSYHPVQIIPAYELTLKK